MAKQNISNYLNTLIFCVISKMITILVLAFLLNDKVRYFSYFLLTIELGLVAIILVSLYVIIAYDRKMSKKQDEYNRSLLSNLTCPDYYVQISENDSIVCNNTYVTPDQKYRYEFNVNGNTSKIELETDFQKKTIDEICTEIQDASYSNVSWTTLRPRCNYSDY